MMKKTLLALSLLIMIGAQAQQELIESGDFNFEHHFYKEAVKDYTNALGFSSLESGSRLHAKQQLAYSYHLLFDYEKAEAAYHSLAQDTNNHDLRVFLNYGHVLRNNGKYTAASL
ncbi:MAG: hypothetical protein JKY54_00555, partial [Flavobacteriales bacterium]|nr:hypothetical protein [Flavobacteriales bacterium]